MMDFTAGTEVMFKLELCKHTGCKILTECSTVPPGYTLFRSPLTDEQGEPLKDTPSEFLEYLCCVIFDIFVDVDQH